jgi:hypothetical protein
VVGGVRARNIKPGVFDNDLLAECKPLARILYMGLWCYADKEGRFEWRPKRVKKNILPYDNCNVTDLANQLVEKGFLLPYQEDEIVYGCIPTFLEHQHPHPNEKKSRIPIPKEIIKKFNDISGNVNVKKYIYPNISNQDSKDQTDDFDRFWQAYPRKKSKGQAEKSFTKINPDEQLLAIMLATIERAKKSEDWRKDNGKWIPYPSTWLNAKGWEDEHEVEVNAQDNPFVCPKCNEERDGISGRGENKMCNVCRGET